MGSEEELFQGAVVVLIIIIQYIQIIDYLILILLVGLSWLTCRERRHGLRPTIIGYRYDIIDDDRQEEHRCYRVLKEASGIATVSSAAGTSVERGWSNERPGEGILFYCIVLTHLL